jgi:hypothetical protein
VRRTAYKYWSAALILTCRLVFGELAHAMPHEGAAGQETPNAPAHCEDHALAESLDVDSKALVNESHESRPDCCENGTCGCPCVHVSALDAPRILPFSEPLQTLRATESVSGLAQKQLSTLLRPPADA